MKKKYVIKKIIVLVLLLGVALAVFLRTDPFAVAKPNAPAGKAGDDNIVVVELFTSQGCSSCPPADVLLGKLSETDGLIALAWHVTYWDRLGWTDPFGLKQATNLQYAYSRAMGQTRVYTPQMIVNGSEDVVGNDGLRVKNVIRAQKRKADRGRINVAIESDELIIGLPQAPSRQNCTIWVMSVKKKQETQVKRGENKGRNLTDYHIVTGASQIGRWGGDERELRTELTKKMRGGDYIAVLARNPGPGAICAAGDYSFS